MQRCMLGQLSLETFNIILFCIQRIRRTVKNIQFKTAPTVVLRYSS